MGSVNQIRSTNRWPTFPFLIDPGDDFFRQKIFRKDEEEGSKWAQSANERLAHLSSPTDPGGSFLPKKKRTRGGGGDGADWPKIGKKRRRREEDRQWKPEET